jgi:DNA-binding beta-propeller fold protein YncE
VSSEEKVTTSTTNAAIRSARQYLAAAIVLLVLVLALGALYFVVSQPPKLSGQAGSRDPNFQFSIYGFQGDLLRRPTGVAVDPSGNIYVADTGKRRIVEFDSSGNFVTTYGDFGHGPLQLWSPIGVAVAPDGRSYVLDKSAKKIVMYDAQHKPIKQITFQEYPLSVVVANGGLFVTTDSGVLIGDLDGNLETGYISHGRNAGQFDKPGGVAVGPDGTIYVCDSFNYRIQAIGTNGKPKWVYGSPLPPGKAIQYQGKDRKFGFPASIATDGQGHLYVVDGTNSQLVILDTNGTFVRTMGDVGHDDGMFYYPDGIAYGGNRLVVADKFNDRVEVFNVPSFGLLSGWRAYAPWALLLALIPLLVLFWPRGRRFIAAPEFITAMGADAHGPEVAAALGKVQIPSELLEAATGMTALKVRWIGVAPEATKVAELVSAYGLTTPQAETVAIALAARGKKVILAEGPAMLEAATKLGIPVLTYEDLVETFTEPAPPDDADRPAGPPDEGAGPEGSD